VVQHPVGKNGGEVFGGGGGRDMDAHITVGVGFEAFEGAALNIIFETELLKVAVKERMNAPMCGLLADKALHLLGKILTFRFWQRLEAAAHGVHEVLFAHRKAHGQGAEKSRPERIAAIPPGGKWRVEVN
jgi:hypothetical protein